VVYVRFVSECYTQSVMIVMLCVTVICYTVRSEKTSD